MLYYVPSKCVNPNEADVVNLDMVSHIRRTTDAKSKPVIAFYREEEVICSYIYETSKLRNAEAIDIAQWLYTKGFINKNPGQ